MTINCPVVVRTVMQESRSESMSIRLADIKVTEVRSVGRAPSGHNGHSLHGIDPVDRGDELYAIFDLCARYETIITERELKRTALFIEVKPPSP